MIPSSELVSFLLGVTGDEPEIVTQRENEFEVKEAKPHHYCYFGLVMYRNEGNLHLL